MRDYVPHAYNERLQKQILYELREIKGLLKQNNQAYCEHVPDEMGPDVNGEMFCTKCGIEIKPITLKDDTRNWIPR